MGIVDHVLAVHEDGYPPLPVDSSTSGRSRLRKGMRISSKSISSARSRRATLPQRQTMSVGALQRVQRRHGRESSQGRAAGSLRSRRAASSAAPIASPAILYWIGCERRPRSIRSRSRSRCHPTVRVERLLVRARAPAELAPGLRRAVGPAVRGRSHLGGRERPAATPAEQPRRPRGHARRQLDRRVDPRETAEVGEQPVEGEVAPCRGCSARRSCPARRPAGGRWRRRARRPPPRRPRCRPGCGPAGSSSPGGWS